MQYNYDPADYTPVGEVVRGGPPAGKVRTADGRFVERTGAPAERPAGTPEAP